MDLCRAAVRGGVALHAGVAAALRAAADVVGDVDVMRCTGQVPRAMAADVALQSTASATSAMPVYSPQSGRPMVVERPVAVARTSSERSGGSGSGSPAACWQQRRALALAAQIGARLQSHHLRGEQLAGALDRVRKDVDARVLESASKPAPWIPTSV
jgi:hypothetical protein